jgi:hypothetical protein
VSAKEAADLELKKVVVDTKRNTFDLTGIPSSESSSKGSSSEYDPQSDSEMVGLGTPYEANLPDEEHTPRLRHPDSFFHDDEEHLSSAGEDSVGDVPATSSRRGYYESAREGITSATPVINMTTEGLEGVLHNRCRYGRRLQEYLDNGGDLVAEFGQLTQRRGWSSRRALPRIFDNMIRPWWRRLGRISASCQRIIGLK